MKERIIVGSCKFLILMPIINQSPTIYIKFATTNEAGASIQKGPSAAMLISHSRGTCLIVMDSITLSAFL